MATTEINKISSSKRELTITLSKDELEPIREKQAKKLQKEVQFPGFRKGRAPLNLVKRQYADTIEAYTLDAAVDEGLRQAIQENELYIVGTPEAKKLDFDDDGNMVTIVEVETYPEVELKNYTGFEFTRDVYEITDKFVEDSIDRLRRERAEVQLVDGAVEEGHIVTLDMQELDENGRPIEGKKYENMTIHVGQGKFDSDLEKQIIGMKNDEEKEIEKVYPDDYPQKEVAGKTERYLVKIKNIEQEILPELNDEFVKKDLNIDIETVEELRKLTRENLEKNYKTESENRLVGDIYQKLIEENPFDVPQALVDDYLNHIVNDVKKSDPRLREEDIRKYYENEALYNLKLFYLKDAIAKAENIEVTDEDVEKFLAELDDEKVRQMYKENERLLNGAKEDIRSRKILDFLMENSKIADNKVTLE